MALMRENVVLSPLLNNEHPVTYRYLKGSTLDNRDNISSGSGISPGQQVINLTQAPLSEHQVRLLNKGLSFCPTTPIDNVELCQSITRFNRRVRLAEWAHTENIPTCSPHLVHPQKTKKTWTPNSNRNQYIDSFVETVDQYLRKFLHEKDSTPRTIKDNLTSLERKALRELRSNDTLVIKPADKGGAIVIQTTQDYISEAQRQLADPNFYSEQDSDCTPQIMARATELINQFSGEVRDDVKDLLPNNPQPGQFYLLPKWHKIYSILESLVQDIEKPVDDHNVIQLALKYHIVPPGRPIVSGVNTPTEFLSAYVDTHLQPLLKLVPSYIQDSTHFLRRLSDEVPSVPAGSLLVTLDVSSLYTNIPHTEGIQACQKFLRQKYSRDKTNDLISIIKFILENNYFCFLDKFYHQTSGTAMGTRMAPCYANLFMASFESSLLEHCPKKPAFYVRYIDDIFLIWPHGLNELLEFKVIANSFHTKIKFTLDYSSLQIPFLDILIYLKGEQLCTTLYTKPTDSHSYLLYNSFHPPHIKRSIVYSQLLRIKRICSEPDDEARCASDMMGHFLKRGYPFRMVKELHNKVSRTNREDLLKYREKTPNTRIPITVTYHPDLSGLLKNIRGGWKSLSHDPSLPDIFKGTPVTAFKQPPNLRDLLVHSKQKNPSNNVSDSLGNRHCGNSRCKMCSHMMCDTTIIIPPTGITLRPGRFDCNSANVVYLLMCCKCPTVSYIGETQTSFRSRFNNHKASIRKNLNGFPVAEHFNLPDHNLGDLKFAIIQGGFNSADSRKQQELKFILRCKSQVHGLNKNMSFMAKYGQ